MDIKVTGNFDPDADWVELAKRTAAFVNSHPDKINKTKYRYIRSTGRAVVSRVIAHIRHEMTDYEQVLESVAPQMRTEIRDQLKQQADELVLAAYPFLKERYDAGEVATKPTGRGRRH